ncbi:hypothetical protein Tco_0770307 [Tanacetum coccineum]|uniref:Xylulose kinase-1 n=1 Tax=Tanacetum coccineum TaxID=301880 RepID=A0ABQ4ZDS1_9ASTR
MGWVVCYDAVVRSCDAVLVFTVTASRVICGTLSLASEEKFLSNVGVEWELEEASHQRVTDGVYRVLPPASQEEQFADEKERKARTLLLMAVPKDHLRRFHGMDDAKEIWAAIKNTICGKDLEKGYDRKVQAKAQEVIVLYHLPLPKQQQLLLLSSDEVIQSFLAQMPDDVDLIHEDLDQND